MLFSSPFAIAIAKLSDYFIEQLASGIKLGAAKERWIEYDGHKEVER
jgi:hypothetical protein